MTTPRTSRAAPIPSANDTAARTIKRRKWHGMAQWQATDEIGHCHAYRDRPTLVTTMARTFWYNGVSLGCRKTPSITPEQSAHSLRRIAPFPPPKPRRTAKGTR